VPDAVTAQKVLHEAVRRGLTVTRFDLSYPSINDVFLSLVRGLPGDGQTGTSEPMTAATGASRDLVGSNER